VLDMSNMCSHSHMKILDAKGWIKPKQKHNVKVKVKCAMWNKQIDGLTTNHNPKPLPKQKWIRALNVEEKIDLRDVLWWMSIKDVCRPGALVTTKLSKEGCISLAIGGRLFHVAHKHDWSRCGSP
jgi:hypothetical protein